MEEKKKKLTGRQGELMRALEITPDDLMANDDGFITDSQRDSIVKRQGYAWFPFTILSLVFLGMGLILPSIIISQDVSDTPIALGLAIFFLGMVTIFQGIRYVSRENIKQELSRNKVATTQGIAVVNVSEDSSHLEINGLKLKAPADVLRRIKHLDPYVVHYLPNTKVILSMEELSDGDNIRQDMASSRLQDEHEDDTSYTDDSEQQSQINSKS